MRLKPLNLAAICALWWLIFSPAVLKAADEAPGVETPNLFNAGIRMFVTLVILIGGLLLVLYLMRKFTKARQGIFGNQDIIRVIATHHLAPKNFITVVEVGDSVLTLGVTGENISCLDKTPVDSFSKKTQKLETQSSKVSFAQRLKALTGQGSVS